MHKFEKEERVLCFHGPLLYEAKVLKVEFWDVSTYGDEAGPHYFVHYKGWKQSWDEWVPEDRIMKLDDENLTRQKELQTTYGLKKDDALHKKDKKTSGDSSASTMANPKKRLREGAHDKEDEYLKRPEIRIPLPDNLKARLVDDWENITKCQRLVSLPRDPSVSKVLEMYRDFKLQLLSKEEHADEDRLNEIIEGLKLYFDKSLGTILLYRYERPQYAEILKKSPGKRMCDIYGSEHLLRLFVQLPFLIVHTTMDKETVLYLKEQLSHIIIYLQRNMDNLFLDEYENAPPEYLHAQ